MRQALLLTGVPGVGKTTVLRNVAQSIGGKACGFLTDEIRKQGKRVGFAIETLEGESATLAHQKIRSSHRVGRYRVDLAALDRIVDLALRPRSEPAVVLVDEIGKMECLSGKFTEAVSRLLDSEHIVVATVARKGGGFIERVKQRPNVEMWEVTRENRGALVDKILAWLGEQGCP